MTVEPGSRSSTAQTWPGSCGLIVSTYSFPSRVVWTTTGWAMASSTIRRALAELASRMFPEASTTTTCPSPQLADKVSMAARVNRGGARVNHRLTVPGAGV